MDQTRRGFLFRSIGTLGSVLSWNIARAASPQSPFKRHKQDQPRDRSGDELLGIVPFDHQSGDLREVVYGEGLDGRRRIDLSTLTEESLITSTQRFYIRTRCPDLIDYEKPWSIRIDGRVKEKTTIPIQEVLDRARPMGIHLLECAASAQGGLVSAAEWSGVPVVELLSKVKPRNNDHRILISGFDQHSEFDPDFDKRGANWIFTLQQLQQTGAFLATSMNHKPIPPDHGQPVRLVVPGWYGCTCVKWVNRIRYVSSFASSTNHMRDYAGRTHQQGIPKRARDFIAPVIDLCAMPIRIEKWRIDQQIQYRVVGILWGGNQTTDQLEIQFNNEDTFIAVESLNHQSTSSWTLWSHTWLPGATGVYHIRLRVNDPKIRTRRLDSNYYQKTVTITEVK